MTTETSTTNNDRSRPAYTGETLSMYRTIGDANRQGTRLKRLILIGAIASFLSFFGLTVAFDYQSQQGVQVQSQASTVNFRSLISDDDDDDDSASAPQMRTRTS